MIRTILPVSAVCKLFVVVFPLIAGCSATSSANDGAGFSALHPSGATRKFIVQNDKPFAKEVVAHNATCTKQKACVK